MANTNQWTISASQKVIEDPLTDALVLLSHFFGSPCSASSLLAGLPLDEAILTPELFPQAAARAGFNAKLFRKQLKHISPLMQPCILLLKDQKACLLMALDHQANQAKIQLTESGGEQQLSLEALAELYVGYLFLVKPSYRTDRGWDVFFHDPSQHWLWQTIKEARSIYRDALIASILVNLFALVSPLFIMNVYDKILPNLAFDSLWVLAIGAALAFVFDFIMRQLRSYLIDLAGKKVDIIVSSKLFAKVLGMPFVAKSPSVGAMAKQLNEFDSIRDFLTSATLTALVDLPFAILFFSIIFLIAGDMVTIPLVCGLLILIYSLLRQPSLKRAIQETNKFSAVKHGHLIESLSLLESIKAYGTEGLMQKSWQQMTGHTATWQLKTKQVTNSVAHVASLIVQLSVIGVVIYGVYRVAAGELSMGGIIASVMLTSRAIAPLAAIANLMTRANHTYSAIEQLNQIMAQPDEFARKGHLAPLERLQGKIDCDQLEFRYPNSDAAAIAALQLRIEPKEKIAIIGRNGSGKSTLAKLLIGLLPPTTGNLRYDGVDSAQRHPADLRRNFGYLPQDINLIHGSIRDNILFGTRQVTEHQLIRAVKLSGVSLFTQQESEGLDRQVGEGGQALSRGQRQCVALARAILNDPPILLMDEPTASLDARAEKQFMQAMKQVSQQRSLILVTHKMPLLTLVDRIIVLEKGRIIADGAKATVLAQLNHLQAEPLNQAPSQSTEGR